ncbi:MAG: hypothetical protein HYS12_14900 [Planctomycetes bacterium]|nr:hypothetical protein [Planctomycetota bacterium]
MILNTYAVLDAFLSLLRGMIGLLVLWIGVSTWWAWLRRPPGPEGRKELEDRGYLLFLLAGLLLALNVLSWPVFYLLLQSYVPEWGDSVMCIYGVTKIGLGSLGPSRFLPPLVTALQTTKPVLIFLSGAWFVLYLVNRRTHTAPLTGRVLLLLLASGLLAVTDAAAESAYLVIPKKEVFLSSGCCTEAFDWGKREVQFLPQALVGENKEGRLYAAYYGSHGGMVLALAGCIWLCRRRLLAVGLAPLLLGAILCGAVNVVFLIEVVAPRLLHLPYHHCPYDLVPRGPEGIVSAALSLGGSFAVGWACVAGWLGRDPESRAYLPATVRVLLRVALLSYFWAMLMTFVELALA